LTHGRAHLDVKVSPLVAGVIGAGRNEIFFRLPQIRTNAMLNPRKCSKCSHGTQFQKGSAELHVEGGGCGAGWFVDEGVTFELQSPDARLRAAHVFAAGFNEWNLLSCVPILVLPPLALSHCRTAKTHSNHFLCPR